MTDSTRKEIIHFPFGDARHCGSSKRNQRFAFDLHEITCPSCKAQDRVFLTPQGKQLVAHFEAVGWDAP